MDRLPDWVTVGATFVYSLWDKDVKYHVRGIVDGRAVVKSWNPRKRRWDYGILDALFFEFRGNGIKNVKKSP